MSHSPTQRKKWIETGYRHFAEFGPHELKIKAIAHDAGLSRTTFYHFFTDLEDFIDQLLNEHRSRADEYYEDVRQCRTYDPDLFNVLETHSATVLFHRQLLLNKENHTYYLIYQVLNRIGCEIIYPLWAQNFGFEGNALVGIEIYLMLVDIWYLNMQPEDLSAETLQKNSHEIRQQVEAFAKSHHIHALSNG